MASLKSTIPLRWRGLAGELVRFVGVGLFSFSFGAGLSAFQTEIIGVREEVSVAITLAVLLITNFLLSARYVFRSSGTVTFAQFLRFSVAAVAMRGSEYVLFLLMFKNFHLNYILALAIAMAVSSIAKFFLYRGLVFRPNTRH